MSDVVTLLGVNRESADRFMSELADRRRHERGALNPEWVPGPWLGAGAFGASRLWVKQDEDGMVVDRVAIKDATKVRERDVWPPKKLQFWPDGVHTFDIKKTVPLEVETVQRLQQVMGKENVVALRNWRWFESFDRARLYQEYCPYGILSEPFPRHNTWGNHIPEAFIWHAFECLATVGLMMERGNYPKGSDAAKQWQLIIHRDMKDQNIFLGINAGDTYRGFPTPKLGDWGLATIYPDGHSYPADERLQDYFCSPPEEREKYLHGRFCARTTQTNVWAIGFQIWTLIEGNKYGPQHFAENQSNWKYRVEPDEFGMAKHFYSQNLLTLVRWCLKWLPQERPTFDQIFREIQTGSLDAKKSAAQALRGAAPSDPRFRWFMHKADNYPLRSMLYDDARKDPKWYNQWEPPAQPRQLARVGRRESYGGQMGTVIKDPPRTVTAPMEALRLVEAEAAWYKAEARRLQEEAEEASRQLQEDMELDAQPTSPISSPPASDGPVYSPLTPRARGVQGQSPVAVGGASPKGPVRRGAGRQSRAQTYDRMGRVEMGRVEKPKVPTTNKPFIINNRAWNPRVPDSLGQSVEPGADDGEGDPMQLDTVRRRSSTRIEAAGPANGDGQSWFPKTFFGKR